MAHPNRLKDARVLVFGGTSGIGFAVANMAVSNGAYVTISGSNQPKVDEKISKLRSFYPELPAERVSGIAVELLDLSNLEANLETLFEKVTDKGSKKIDHIAFTAGDVPSIPKIEEMDIDSAMHGFKIRFLCPAMIAKFLALGKYMSKDPSSSFTITGGALSKKPAPGRSLATGWAASVEGLTRGLAVDLSPIRVNVVVPGTIHTEILQRITANGGQKALDNLRMNSGLLKTLGQPEDTAEAYGWIMKDRFVTGSEANTDGGRLLA
ncbi:NAD(P)-binding protein, partial [Aaosphaeria arxii CBS 175.79]